MTTISRITKEVPWETIFAGLEQEISRIANIEPFDELDDSVVGCLRRKENKYRAAVNRIRQYSGNIEVYNEEHASDIMLNTLLDEIKESDVFHNCSDNTRSETDLKRLEEIVSLNVEDAIENNSDDLLLKLKRTQIEAKNDLECILEIFVPDIKEDIKEILSTLEGARKNAQKEEDSCITFNEPHLLPALEQLLRRDIIEEIEPSKYRIAFLN